MLLEFDFLFPEKYYYFKKVISYNIFLSFQRDFSITEYFFIALLSQCVIQSIHQVYNLCVVKEFWGVFFCFFFIQIFKK